MIYTVGGIKGGSGKTTIATNLAVMLAKEKRDVLLIDADDQETATTFTEWRNINNSNLVQYTAIQLFGNNVLREVLKLKEKYDDIVIDTGGRDTTSQRAAIAVTNVLLIPFVPRSFDIWTIEKVVNLIEEMRPTNPSLKILTFLNKADSRGTDNNDALQLLKKVEDVILLNSPIVNRKAFANASASGLAVIELIPKDNKAIEEIKRLYNNIKKELKQL